MDNHHCKKEVEIAELKQLVKSFEGQEKHVYQNWHDIRALKVRQEEFMKQREETLKHIKEINECQTQLIKEIVKINTSFTTMKYLLAIFFTAFGGIICFLITELIKII